MPYSQYPSTAAGTWSPHNLKKDNLLIYSYNSLQKLYMYGSAHMQDKGGGGRRENITHSFIITSRKLIQSQSYAGNF